MTDQDPNSMPGAFSIPGMSLDTSTPAPTNEMPPTSNPLPASQRLGALESIAGELMSLNSPIFPPTTFDLPDINFSNSVNRGNNNSGIFEPHNAGAALSQMWGPGGGGGQLMGDLTMSTPDRVVSHHQQQMQVQQSLQQIQQQGVTGRFPPTLASPSSSDDSDDLPLAQLAKRQTGSLGTNSRTPTPESSLTSTITNSDTSSPVAATNTTSTTTATTNTEVTPPKPAAAGKKAKPTKRKKKKDPNEPSKPVSAYALFFRDTQATIKGHNPSASFGEVSKIVASMWEQLDPEHKDVYKKKTETAKKQYLKQLAAYRATQVSQSTGEDPDKSPTPPTGPAMSPPQQQQAGHMTSHSPQQAGHMISQSPPQQQQQQQVMMAPGYPAPAPGGVVMSPPHMVPQTMEEQPILQQMSPQMMHHHQQQQQHQHMMQQQHLQQQQLHMQQQQQHQQQMMGGIPDPHHHHPNIHHHSPPQQMVTDQPNMYTEFMEQPPHDMNYVHCVRAGCTNQARENPSWDSEYCSNDCVITHCRDVFTTWVGARSGSNTFPVK